MIRKTVSVDPTSYVLYKATLSRLGDVANLPNTGKQKQRGNQSEETKKYFTNKRKKEKKQPQKLNKIEANNLPDTNPKTLFITMMKKFCKNFNKMIVSTIRGIKST